MCIMALLYRTAKDTPVLVAANREEMFDRPSLPPKIQSGSPRVICGVDRKAGGTWLGVNQFGLFAAVANRRKTHVPEEPRSRGLLCRELLDCQTAREAAQLAAEELATGAYAGANFVVADASYAGVVHGGDRIEVVGLKPGLHVITNGDVDDPQDERHEFIRRMLTLHTLDSSVTFLAVASNVFSRRPDAQGRRGVVITGSEYGTVSSALLALGKKLQQSILQYTPGPPSQHSYEDLSALLRQVLSTNRPKRTPAAKPSGKNGEKNSSKSRRRARKS